MPLYTPPSSGAATDPDLAFFGTGSDGPATISGSTTITRDMHYTDLTVTGTLLTDLWRVFVRGTLTVESGGVIHVDGTDAAANVNGAARGSNQRSLSQGSSGGVGNNTGAGTAGAALGNAVASLGGAGGTGGASGANAGGAGGSVANLGSTWAAVPYFNGWKQLRPLLEGGTANAVINQAVANSAVIGTGTGGGSGATDGGAGGAGGGGGGGGFVLINANAVVNNGRISANGGNGGNAGSNNAGGGGGGGGGVVFVNHRSFTGNTPQANGGSPGAKIGTGLIGVVGNNGTVHLFEVA